MSQPPAKESWKMFDEISSTYDNINRILSFGMDRHWRKKVAKWLPRRADLALLDLATGTGDQIFSLFEYSERVTSATGIDLSLGMLEIAQKKALEKPYRTKIQWREADAQHLPFPDKSFDVATFAFGIRNVPEPLHALREIHRVLKPEGRCLILEFSLPPSPMRSFYLFYLRHLLPYIGKALSKHKTAYRYLNQTIESFPSGKAFCSLLEQTSFLSVQAHPMALGAVTLYIGDK